MIKKLSFENLTGDLRSRAEKLLAVKGREVKKIPLTDVLSLVQELRVHQIELEMQNEELRQAQESIAEARDRYADLYDFAPVGYFTLNRKGKITELNLTGAGLLGAERSRLVNQPFSRWVAPEFQEACRAHFLKVFATGVRQTCEVKIRRQDGKLLFVGLESLATPGGGGPEGRCRTTMSDITGRQQAEAVLRESEERFRAIFEQAAVGVAQMETVSGRFLKVNRKYCDIIGFEPNEITATTSMAITHPDDLEADLDNMRQLRDGLIGQFSLEKRYRRQDGSLVWVNLTVSPMWGPGEVQDYYIAVAEDITARKMAEAEVKRGLEKLRLALQGTVAALANTVEIKDPYIAGHHRGVAQLAGAMARELGWPPDQVEGMEVLSCLHDLGKIAVPTEILSKPGIISPAEFALIKVHPQVGYDILKDIKFPWPVAQAVLQHHERLDGSGYPQGLKREEILPEARILAVADVVEAMASHRPYRPALGIETALQEIISHKGKLYDPDVVDICVKLFTEKGFAFDQFSQP